MECSSSLKDLVTFDITTKNDRFPKKLFCYMKIKKNPQKILVPNVFYFLNFGRLPERFRFFQTKTQTIYNLILKPFQRRIIDKIFAKRLTKSNVVRGLGTIIIQLDPGLGKTIISLAMIEIIGEPTVIIVPTHIIRSQWIEELTKYCLTSVKVLIINTARANLTLLSNAYIIVYDEVHEYATKFNMRVFWPNSPVKIGLSATPVRPDNAQIILRGFFGSPVNFNHEVKPKQECAVMTLASKYPVDVFVNGTFNFSQTVDNIITCQGRNLLIINKTIELFNDGHNIIIFTSRIWHVMHLAYFLKDYYPQILCGRNNSIFDESPRIVIATYSMAKRGLSLKNLTALIVAIPQHSLWEQVVGRIFRINTTMKKKRQIVDILDVNSILLSSWRKRQSVYIKLGLDIVDHLS